MINGGNSFGEKQKLGTQSPIIFHKCTQKEDLNTSGQTNLISSSLKI